MKAGALASLQGDSAFQTEAFVLLAVLALFAGAVALWPRGQGRRLAGRIYALAVLGFREGLRQKVLWTVALLSLLPGALAYYSDADGTHAGRARLILETSIGAGEILGAALIVMLSALSVSREIESRIMHTLGTKPVPRWGILLGKALGFFAVDLLFLAGLLLYAGLLVRAVPLRPETRSAAVMAGSGTWEDLRRNTLTTRHYIDIDRKGEAKASSRRVRPGQPYTARFQLGDGSLGGEPLAVRLQMSSNTFAPTIPDVDITIGEPGATPLIKRRSAVPQGRAFDLFIDPADLRGNSLDVTLLPGGRDAVILVLPGEGKDGKFRSGGIRVGLVADGFWENLFKAFALLALQGWILALITTAWSGVLSFPVTVALGLIVALGGASSQYAVDLMRAGAERAEAVGQAGEGLQSSVTEAVFFVVRLLPDFQALGGPAVFLDGTYVSLGALAHAILWMGLVRCLGWSLPGVLLFQRREVGA